MASGCGLKQTRRFPFFDKRFHFVSRIQPIVFHFFGRFQQHDHTPPAWCSQPPSQVPPPGGSVFSDACPTRRRS
jgi:hypothetical protein